MPAPYISPPPGSHGHQGSHQAGQQGPYRTMAPQATDPAQHYHAANHHPAHPAAEGGVTAAPPKRAIFTPYVAAWSAVGVLAAGYMLVLGIAPELTSDLSPASAFVADPQSNQGQRAAARLVADVNAIKDSIAGVQLELSKIKTDVAGQNVREKALSAQLVALEHRLASQSGIEGNAIDAAEPAAPTAPGARGVSAPRDPASPPDVKAEALPASVETPDAPAPAANAGTPQQPKLVNADSATLVAHGLAIETGSVPAPAARAVKPAAAKPAAAQPVAQAGQAAPAAQRPAAQKPAAAEVSEPIDFGEAVVTPEPRTVGVQISPVHRSTRCG